MRGLWVLIALAGCGRVGFDPLRTSTSDAMDSGSPSDAKTTIKRIQAANPTFVSSATIGALLDVSAGDVVVAVAYWNNAGFSVSIADSSSNSWSANVQQQSIPTGCHSNVGTNARIFYALITNGGPTTITVTQSGTGFPLSLLVVEYAGISSSLAYDGSVGQVAPSSSNAMSAGTLTTQHDDVIVAAFHDSQGMGTMVPGPGLTTLALDTQAYALFGEQIGPPGNYPITATLPAGTNDACWVATAVALAGG